MSTLKAGSSYTYSPQVATRIGSIRYRRAHYPFRAYPIIAVYVTCVCVCVCVTRAVSNTFQLCAASCRQRAKVSKYLCICVSTTSVCQSACLPATATATVLTETPKNPQFMPNNNGSERWLQCLSLEAVIKLEKFS